MHIYFDEVQTDRTDKSQFFLKLTVSDGLNSEPLYLPLSKQTALSLSEILQEEPFDAKKPGAYSREVFEVVEQGRASYLLRVQISKGHSRIKKNLSIEKPVFLELWNVLHFQVLPSQLPEQRRAR